MSRTLFVAWRAGDDTTGSWGPVGRLSFDGTLYRFYYTAGAQKLPGFKPFAGMEELNKVYETRELFPLFANRILSPSRPEYEEFLRWGGFDPDTPPDPIAVLSVTEGKRQTDAIEVFPCPEPDSDGCYLSKFFLHGIRWAPGAEDLIAKLRPGDQLAIAPEATNPSDPNAVAVFVNNARIGYVPRYLARDVGQLLVDCGPYVTLCVDRINPTAPLQHRILCRMNACWPEGFTPCSGPLFAPIPTNVSANCSSVT